MSQPKLRRAAIGLPSQSPVLRSKADGCPSLATSAARISVCLVVGDVRSCHADRADGHEHPWRIVGPVCFQVSALHA